MTEENNPKKIVSGDDYISSIRKRGLKVYFFGEEIEELVDNKIILLLSWNGADNFTVKYASEKIRIMSLFCKVPQNEPFSGHHPSASFGSFNGPFFGTCFPTGITAKKSCAYPEIF